MCTNVHVSQCVCNHPQPCTHPANCNESSTSNSCKYTAWVNILPSYWGENQTTFPCWSTPLSFIHLHTHSRRHHLLSLFSSGKQKLRRCLTIRRDICNNQTNQQKKKKKKAQCGSRSNLAQRWRDAEVKYFCSDLLFSSCSWGWGLYLHRGCWWRRWVR